jgi:uncharacterized protein (TIGR02246 family)
MAAVLAPAALSKAGGNARDEVNRVHRAYHRAVAERSPDAVAMLYTRDARYLPPTTPGEHGRAAIRRHFVKLFAEGLCGFSATTRAIHPTGSLVVDFLRYRTSLCTNGKVTERIVGNGVLVLRPQRDHSLRILYDIFTAA